MFNPAYYPARVGDSVLIGLKDSCIGITDAKTTTLKIAMPKITLATPKPALLKITMKMLKITSRRTISNE